MIIDLSNIQARDIERSGSPTGGTTSHELNMVITDDHYNIKEHGSFANYIKLTVENIVPLLGDNYSLNIFVKTGSFNADFDIIKVVNNITKTGVFSDEKVLSWLKNNKLTMSMLGDVKCNYNVGSVNILTDKTEFTLNEIGDPDFVKMIKMFRSI